MKKKLFEENQAVLKGFVAQIPVSQVQGRSEFEEKRDSLLLHLIVDSMAGQPERWDKLCQKNIGWIGDGFISKLSGTYQGLSKDQLDTIASVCFRFLLEFDLSLGANLDSEFEYAKNFTIDRADDFEPDAKQQIRYACHAMPIAICKSVLNSDEIGGIKSLKSSLKKAEEWAQELSAKEEKVNSLKEYLEKYEKNFNFVGLHKGFDGLAKEKIKERKFIFVGLLGLGILAVGSVIGGFIIHNILDGTKAENITQLAAHTLPFITLVALFIYYFRVLLFNYRAVKSQLMQIELRKALCLFVQDYSEHAKKIKENTPEVFDRFDKLVFSEIMADEGNLPSPHDGVEQITKQIANALKSLPK